MTKNKPKLSGAELARELDVSETLVSRKRSSGKTDEEIRQEAKEWAEQSDKPESHWSAKQRKEKALADLYELDLAKKKGELIGYDDVNQFISTMIIRARDILLRIAPELRDRLAAETDPIKIHQMIEGEIVRALHELKEVSGE